MKDPRPLARLADSLPADWMDEREASAGYVPVHIYEEKKRVTIHAFSQEKDCLMKVVYNRGTAERTVEKFDIHFGKMMSRRTDASRANERSYRLND